MFKLYDVHLVLPVFTAFLSLYDLDQHDEMVVGTMGV